MMGNAVDEGQHADRTSPGDAARPKGGGLFLLYKGKVVFGVKSITPATSVGGGLLVGLTGIGGKVEPGETFLEATIRECLEEIGVAPSIVDFPEPVVVDASCATPKRTVEPDGSLFVVVLKPIPGFDKDLEVHVFGAVLTEPPKPIEKLRHILLIPPDLLPLIDSSHPTLRDAVKQGVDVISADLGACDEFLPPELRELPEDRAVSGGG